MAEEEIQITAAQIHKLKTYERWGWKYKQGNRWYFSNSSRGQTFRGLEKKFINTLSPGEVFTDKNGLQYLQSLLITAYEEQTNDG